MKTNKDKKITIKFILMMILAGTVGFVASFVALRFEIGLSAIIDNALNFLVKNSLVIMFLCYITVIFMISNFTKGQKARVKALAGDDEYLFEKADEYLGNCLNATTISAALSFMAFGLMACGFSQGLYSVSNIIYPIIEIVIFLLLMGISMFFQIAAVNETKKLYPEKQGNVLDTKFQKDWFNSCDEAEKALVGAAAYKSFITTTKALVVCVVMVILLSIVYPVGPLPIILVCSLWLVQSISYMKAVKECGKSKN